MAGSRRHGWVTRSKLHRRDVLVTVDGADATCELVARLTALDTAAGRRVHCSVGFDLDERAPADHLERCPPGVTTGHPTQASTPKQDQNKGEDQGRPQSGARHPRE